jgi:hypothetical protein
VKPDFTPYFETVCPTPRKARWLEEDDALATLDYVQQRGSTAVRPVRAYRCPCGWWHLTAQPEPAPATPPTLDAMLASL